jgi:hypothetical protein
VQVAHNVRPYHFRKVLQVKAEGKGILLNPLWNKGTAFNDGERDRLALRGLIPSRVLSFEDQISRVMDQFHSEPSPFRKCVNCHLSNYTARAPTPHVKKMTRHCRSV